MRAARARLGSRGTGGGGGRGAAAALAAPLVVGAAAAVGRRLRGPGGPGTAWCVAFAAATAAALVPAHLVEPRCVRVCLWARVRPVPCVGPPAPPSANALCRNSRRLGGRVHFPRGGVSRSSARRMRECVFRMRPRARARRYWTVPVLLGLAHMPPRGAAGAVATLLAFVAVGACTLWVFLARPFVGPDGAEARFMW